MLAKVPHQNGDKTRKLPSTEFYFDLSVKYVLANLVRRSNIICARADQFARAFH